jgi:hypothetical protein
MIIKRRKHNYESCVVIYTLAKIQQIFHETILSLKNYLKEPEFVIPSVTSA